MSCAGAGVAEARFQSLLNVEQPVAAIASVRPHVARIVEKRTVARMSINSFITHNDVEAGGKVERICGGLPRGSRHPLSPGTALHEPRSAAVPAASCGGVSPPARTPGETPGKLAGEDACATSAGQFMVPMHAKKRMEAFHEPPRSGSGSLRESEPLLTVARTHTVGSRRSCRTMGAVFQHFESGFTPSIGRKSLLVFMSHGGAHQGRRGRGPRYGYSIVL
jgi:hypothetical protein